jgi:hypothetical protein
LTKNIKSKLILTPWKDAPWKSGHAYPKIKHTKKEVLVFIIKSKLRCVAIVVLAVFLHLVLLEAMPLASMTPQGGSTAIARNDDSPHVFESTQEAATPVKKKRSLLPMVLIGVAAIGIAAVLYFTLAKKYDITGTWTVNNSIFNTDYIITFSGNKSSGDVKLALYLDTGTYSVKDKDVTFSHEYAGNGWDHIQNYTGKFEDAEHMSGTVTELNRKNGTTKTGIWSATRQ